MASGLLAGAVAGLGKSLQHNAQSSIEEKRQAALGKLSHERTKERDNIKWERESEAASASAARDDQHRQQDREWEMSDADREHQSDLELQRVRNRRGYGGNGGRLTANQREAHWLVEQGIAPNLESAWPMVSARADQSGESIDYVEGRIEELESVLNDQDALMSLGGSEEDLNRQVEQMRKELDFFRGKRDELAANRFDIRSPGLLNQGPNGGGGSGGGGGQPAPSSQQGAGGASSVDDILNSVLR